MSQTNPSNNLDERIVTAWQAQLAQAADQPGLTSLLQAQGQRLFDHFAAAYRAIFSRSRQQRRGLLRKLGMTAAGAALALALYGAAPAYAASIPVDNTTCTLIDAITAANTDTAVGGCAAGSGADTITLSGDVVLTAVNNYGTGLYSDYVPTGLPVISSMITLEGNGYTISRDASAPDFRIFDVSATGNLTLNSATVTGGRGFKGGALYNFEGTVAINHSTFSNNYAAYEGGAIGNFGTLTLTDSTISGNTTALSGGGILNKYGTLTVSNSTVSGNSAQTGGGIFSNGPLTVSNSTVSGNSTSISGGGIFSVGGLTVSNSTFSGNSALSGGGIYSAGTLTVSNSTFSGNDGGVNGGGIHSGGTMTLNHATVSGNDASRGGGIYNGGTMTLSRSLISGNLSAFGHEVLNGYGATVNVDAFNLFGHDGNARVEGFTPGSSDIVPPQPLSAILDATLANNTNGCSVPATLALAAGSPAIDAAPSGLATDQRGVSRPQGAAFDIGAFEFGATPNCSVATPTPLPTDTPTPLPTDTPTPLPTDTPTPLPTDTPTPLPTNTPTATPTNTPVPPTATPSPTPTSSIPSCNGQAATIYVNGSGIIVGGPQAGNVFAGHLQGTDGADVIVGTNGDDSINAKRGNDLVCALAGDDSVNGQHDNDVIFGGPGSDSLNGSNGTDAIDGGSEDDACNAETTVNCES